MKLLAMKKSLHAEESASKAQVLVSFSGVPSFQFPHRSGSALSDLRSGDRSQPKERNQVPIELSTRPYYSMAEGRCC